MFGVAAGSSSTERADGDALAQALEWPVKGINFPRGAGTRRGGPTVKLRVVLREGKGLESVLFGPFRGDFVVGLTDEIEGGNCIAADCIPSREIRPRKDDRERGCDRPEELDNAEFVYRCATDKLASFLNKRLSGHLMS
jgi:hypothetical protein